MAKLRMTYKNLKALRKSKEYQALLVDLVSVGVVPKATAEGLLGYNIPANLITDDESSGTDDPINEGTEGSGTVTLLHYAAAKGGFVWQTETFTLANDTTEADIIAAAKTAFLDNTIDTISFVELNDAYVEGTSELSAKYIALDPQPEAFANGQLIVCSTTATEESGTEESGTEESGTVTLLYFDATANDNAGGWQTAEYTLTGKDTSDGIIAFAKTAFGVNDLNTISFAQLNPEYVEGESTPGDKYIDLDPQPEAYEDGQLIWVFNETEPGGTGN